MGARRTTTGWTIAAAALLLTTGCGQGPDPAGTAAAPTTAPQATVTASASADAQQGQTPGTLQVKTIPLGTAAADATVVARLPIDSYAGEPGQEFTFDASMSEGSIDKYEWDLDGDGTFEQATTTPILKHTFTEPFNGQLALRVTGPLGSTDTLRVPLRIGSADPRDAPLAPPTNVRAEAVSADGTEVKVTWESDDPRADSWGIAVNGVPVGRAQKSARSITVTDIRRDKDVLLEVVGITADGKVGERAGTTLPAR